MSAKPTPGPWHVQPIGSQRYIEANGPKFICDMQRDQCQDEQEIAELDACAKAIAALPDCLEALQDELTALECWQANHRLSSDLQEGFCISIDKIRSALKKAGCL